MLIIIIILLICSHSLIPLTLYSLIPLWLNKKKLGTTSTFSVDTDCTENSCSWITVLGGVLRVSKPGIIEMT